MWMYTYQPFKEQLAWATDKRLWVIRGACPETLLVLACFVYMCASHTLAMCVCIVSKSQEHVNYLGPGIKIGLVTPLAL